MLKKLQTTCQTYIYQIPPNLNFTSPQTKQKPKRQVTILKEQLQINKYLHALGSFQFIIKAHVQVHP